MNPYEPPGETGGKRCVNYSAAFWLFVSLNLGFVAFYFAANSIINALDPSAKSAVVITGAWTSAAASMLLAAAIRNFLEDV